MFLSLYYDSLIRLKKQNVFHLCSYSCREYISPFSDSEWIKITWKAYLKCRFLSSIPRDFDPVGHVGGPEMLCFNRPLRRCWCMWSLNTPCKPLPYTITTVECSRGQQGVPRIYTGGEPKLTWQYTVILTEYRTSSESHQSQRWNHWEWEGEDILGGSKFKCSDLRATETMALPWIHG